jgi:HD-like signal output (HDOD) protein
MKQCTRIRNQVKTASLLEATKKGSDMTTPLFSNLDEVLSLAGNTTVYRKTLSTLIAKLDDPDSDSKSIAEVLSNDSVLSASVMKVANSAYYGMSGRVTSLPSAISMLGFLTIRSLGVAALLKSTSSLSKGNNDHLILAGIATALASQQEEEEEVQVATVTCAGLLVEIGKTILKGFNNTNYNYGVLLIEREGEENDEGDEDEEKIIALEREIFGFDHCQVGGQLLRRWNFPEEICQAVENHAKQESNTLLEAIIQRAAHLLPLYKSSVKETTATEDNPLSKVFISAQEFIEEYLSVLSV